MNKNGNHQLSIGVLYIIIASSLCHLLPITEIIRSLLALPAFFIIPIAIGKIASIPIKIIFSVDFKLDAISKYIIYWCIGVITIVLIAYFLNYIWLFNAKIYAVLIVILMILGIFYNEKQDRLKVIANEYGGLIPILLVISIGLIAFLFFSNFAPYPHEKGGDSITHNFLSMQIIECNFFDFQGPYLLSLHLLSSIIIQLFNIYKDPYMLWWMGKLMLNVTYSYGLYLFSYQLFNKKSLALLVVLIGTFVVHNNSGLIYLNDLSPKSIILVSYPYFLFFIGKLINPMESSKIDYKQFTKVITLLVIHSISLFFILYYTYNGGHEFSFVDSIGLVLPIYFATLLFSSKHFGAEFKKIYLYIIFTMFSLLLIHITMGFIAFLTILLYLTHSILAKKSHTFASLLSYLGIFIAFSFVILQLEEIMTFSTSTFQIYGTTTLGFEGFNDVFKVITDIYSPVVLFLFLFGCLISILCREKSNVSVLFLVSIISIFIFAPLSSMYRLLVLFNPFMAYLVAYCLIKVFGTWSKKRTLLIKSIVGLTMIVLILSIIGTNMVEIDRTISKYGVFSAVKNDRFLTGYALDDNTPKTTLVLSYSSTLNHKRINSIAIRPFYNTYEEVPKSVQNIFEAVDAKNMYYSVQQLLISGSSDSEYYLGGVSAYQYNHRYEKIKHLIEKRRNFSAVILITKEDADILPPTAIDNLYNSTYFTLLYADDVHENYIFGVNPSPNIPFK